MVGPGPADPLIGLVLVTHGRLAEELRLVMEHVVGPQRSIATVCIGPDDDMEQRRRAILDRVDAMDSGRGVVVLPDMRSAERLVGHECVRTCSSRWSPKH